MHYKKAGIIKNNSKVVVSKNNAGFDVIEKIANQKNTKIIEATSVEIDTKLKGDFQK